MLRLTPESDKYTDWKDHRDQLNSVDDIGFACKITNHESTVATGQIWISKLKYSSPDQVVTDPVNAIKVLDGIAVQPGATRNIEWEESADFLSNFDGAKTIIYAKKKFYLYFMVKETLHIDEGYRSLLS
jgi:hypothetical protein